MSNANETVLTDEIANEAFLAWMRTAPMMKDDDHPMPICFIAGYKAALATQGTIANAAVLGADEPTETEATVACLRDDAAFLRQANPECEMAQNMIDAADLIETLDTALFCKPSAQPSDTPVPKGYVLVPIEPTAMLVEAGYSKHYRLDTALGRQKACADYAQITRVALAINAAPQVAQPSVESNDESDDWKRGWDAGIAAYKEITAMTKPHAYFMAHADGWNSEPRSWPDAGKPTPMPGQTLIKLFAMPPAVDQDWMTKP